MKIVQKSIVLSPKRRGFHVIDQEIQNNLPEIKDIKAGTVNIFLKHTSASLALGENYEKEVRDDLENFFTELADSKPYYTHTYEGTDDMPSHVKSVIIGASLAIPITDGKLNLGTWQGIYLNEHRDRGGSREVVLTVVGTM